MDGDLSALVARLRAVGATLTKAGRLRFRSALLSLEERAAVAANRDALARALASLAAFDALETDEDAAERALRDEVARLESKRSALENQLRRDWLGSLEPAQVYRLASLGKLRPGEDAIWAEERAARLRRAYVSRCAHGPTIGHTAPDGRLTERRAAADAAYAAHLRGSGR